MLKGVIDGVGEAEGDAVDEAEIEDVTDTAKLGEAVALNTVFLMIDQHNSKSQHLVSK